MVRLKHRYILFDVLYPPSRGTKEFANFSSSSQTALLSLHRMSPSGIDQKVILQAIRKVIQDQYGEYGSGLAGSSIVMKYFSSKTSTGIIRCGRLTVNYVVAALALLSKLGDQDVIVRCVHISGTIRKCEDYSIQRSRELMLSLKQYKGNEEFDSILSAFENTEYDMRNVKNDSDDEEESD